MFVGCRGQTGIQGLPGSPGFKGYLGTPGNKGNTGPRGPDVVSTPVKITFNACLAERTCQLTLQSTYYHRYIYKLKTQSKNLGGIYFNVIGLWTNGQRHSKCNIGQY